MVDVRGGHLGVAARRVRHGLADLEPFDVVAEGEHRARAAVADLPGRDHLVPDPPRGLAGAGGEDGLLDHVPHPGVRDGLAHQLGRRLRQRPHLGARADQRVVALHQNLVRAHVRDGKVGDKDPTAPVDHPAEYLLHADLNLPSVRNTRPRADGRSGHIFGAPRYQSPHRSLALMIPGQRWQVVNSADRRRRHKSRDHLLLTWSARPGPSAVQCGWSGVLLPISRAGRRFPPRPRVSATQQIPRLSPP